MATGVTMMEWWETGMTRSAARPTVAYTAAIESTLDLLQARVGAGHMWEWLRHERDDLHGHSPLRCIVGHNLRSVQRLIEAMPPPPPPTPDSDATT